MKSHRFIQDHVSTYKILSTQEDFLIFLNQTIGQKGGYYVALNPEKILYAIKKESLNQILKNADGVIVDGIGAKWAIEKLLSMNCEKITGVDAVSTALKIANEKKLRVGFFGSKKSVLEKIQSQFKIQYPDCNFTFFVSGYENGPAEVADVLEKNPTDLVFVALGSPKQEEWIVQHQKDFPATFFTGVGGSLDVLSGDLQRAPKWIQSMGMEWFFRFLCQPVKRFKRILRLLDFVILVLKENSNHE